jgi:hypothetical protein
MKSTFKDGDTGRGRDTRATAAGDGGATDSDAPKTA